MDVPLQSASLGRKTFGKLRQMFEEIPMYDRATCRPGTDNVESRAKQYPGHHWQSLEWRNGAGDCQPKQARETFPLPQTRIHS